MRYSAEGLAKRRASFAARRIKIFNARIRKTKSCWLWTGGTNGKYGQLNEGKKKVFVHRRVWEIENGPIPSNMQVLHLCDNPLCVRPDHLFLGTQQDNVTDMVIKGRSVAKLTKADVLTIRAALADGVTGKELASRYNVTAGNISAIKYRRTWTRI